MKVSLMKAKNEYQIEQIGILDPKGKYKNPNISM